ncbi:MAG: YihY/virulence factor BrkB family protein [Acidobacteria bacterium]|nr:YihY/virulence factor BrkB family protein [Acidobacteriota bacterium]
MFPFLLVVLGISNHYPRLGAFNRFAIETITASLPAAARAAVVDYLQAIANPSTSQIITCVVLILWTGSWAFSIMERALNRIWRTECRPFLHGRGISVVMMAAVGTLLGISATVTGLLTFLQTSADQLAVAYPQAGSQFIRPLWQIVFGIVGVLLTISLFMLVYIVLPNTRVTLVEALPGAIIAGVAWEGAKHLFARLLGAVPYDQLYGSIAAVLATLTWMYISNLIMLFGAQMTALFHCEHLMSPRALYPSLQRRSGPAAVSISR